MLFLYLQDPSFVTDDFPQSKRPLHLLADQRHQEALHLLPLYQKR